MPLLLVVESPFGLGGLLATLKLDHQPSWDVR